MRSYLAFLTWSVVAVALSSTVRASDTRLTSWGDPDLSGVFVEASVATPTCDLRIVGSALRRAVHISQTRDSLVVRSTPDISLRVIHLRSRRHASGGGHTVRSANGLGRWQAGALVVESRAYGVPLWDRMRVPGSGNLIERFALASANRLSYRVGRDDAAEGSTEASVELVRCQDVRSATD
jgi:hypothetical protein